MAKGKKAEPLVPVGPGADEEDIREESDEREEREVAEEEQQEEEVHAEEEDERVGHGDEQEDDGREAIRERRRAEKRRRKENRDRDRVELNYLRQRNEQLERRQSDLDARVSHGEIVSIEGRIAELDGQIREAERIQGLAISKGDGDTATKAAQIARELGIGRAQLAATHSQRVAQTRAPQQQQPDPGIQAAAREWAERREWYDPNLRDNDSRVAKAIEDQLFNEGRLDARYPEYWEELDRRLAKYMPHRYGNGHRNVRDEDDGDEDEGERPARREEPRRAKGPRITTGGRERPLKSNEVYVSAERKKALQDANAWDDPVLRERYLKQFRKYDREHGRR
jgi:hypothetical protein